MGSVIIQWDQEFQGEDLPVVTKYDPIESPGSLLLLDFSHPLAPEGRKSVVHENTSYANIVAPISGLGGAGTSVNAPGSYAAGVVPLDKRLEWSRLGGLHYLYKQSASTTGSLNGGRYVVTFPNDLRNYLVNNPDHQYYFGMWLRRTREPNGYGWATGVQLSGHGITSGDAARHIFFVVRQPTGAWNKNQKSANFGSLFDFEDVENTTLFTAAGQNTWTNAELSSATLAYLTIASDDAGPFNTSGNNQRAMASWILYRYYVEDLTISGRGYERVKSIDRAMYEKEVLTVGGRYYGDTWTDPATLDSWT